MSSTELTTSTLSTFHPFSKLPINLRQEIWCLVPEPELVTVERPAKRFQPHSQYAGFLRKIPILHVCKDSHIAALKIYKPCFEQQLGRPIYFSKELDTLFLTTRELCFRFSPFAGRPRVEGVKFLAVDFSGGTIYRPLCRIGFWLLSTIVYFPEVEEVLMVKKQPLLDRAYCTTLARLESEFENVVGYNRMLSLGYRALRASRTARGITDSKYPTPVLSQLFLDELEVHATSTD
ncbi:hypothetical protein B7494_g5480 [Chlorociboria aeruginascens]|nr:hypothetical protein B7494_g5480 [Chlorociboria aeruginascens]